MEQLVKDNAIEETAEYYSQKKTGGHRELSSIAACYASYARTFATTAASMNALRASAGLP